MSLAPQRKAGQPGHTSNGVRKPLEVPVVMYKARLRALEGHYGTLSAQKALCF